MSSSNYADIYYYLLLLFTATFMSHFVIYYYLLLLVTATYVSHFVRSRRSYLATTRYLLILFTATYVSHFVRSRRSYSATTRYPPCIATATTTRTSVQSQGNFFFGRNIFFQKNILLFFLEGRLLVILLAPLPQQQLEPARNPKALIIVD
jgi:hypothetical protein